MHSGFPWFVRRRASGVVLGTVLLLTAATSAAQTHRLPVTVIDENGVAVPGARLTLTQPQSKITLRCDTGPAGRCEFFGLPAGAYTLRVEKENFYVLEQKDVRVGEVPAIEAQITHWQEVREVVNVQESPPAVDPAQTAAKENLSGTDIVNIPYPSTRDIRNALPLIPGVVQDSTGDVHIAGGATYQALNVLDGFNITNPASGLLGMRLSADAVRNIDVETSRVSAEYGKASAGVLRFTTGMGDDRYRFAATNFVPSLQTRKGLNFDKWVPRATFSGPIRRGKAWFMNATDAEYTLNIVKELPDGADRGTLWRLSNLSKVQVNLTPANILTFTFLPNKFHSNNAGLSRFTPKEATVEEDDSAYLGTLKDQHYFRSGMLLELGFGVNDFNSGFQPLGDAPYVVRPEGATGNYFQKAQSSMRRVQTFASAYLPSFKLHGTHEFKVGVQADRLTYRESLQRRPITVLREDGTLTRTITFTPSPRFQRNNVELAGYVQDRWSVTDAWLIEPGLRLDWDQIVRKPLVSPRFASTYMVDADTETKFSFGVGLFYDPTNLALISRPQAGQREDLIFAEDGQTLSAPPQVTFFVVNENGLKAPRFLNWSVGMERRLAGAIYVHTEYLHRRGVNGFTYVNQAGSVGGVYQLRNDRRDKYDAVQFVARRTFKSKYSVLTAYTRSSARSNAVIDFGLENAIFSPQAGGRQPWDAPNRVVSWGFLPLIRKFDLGYSLEWRDGFPFSAFNQKQQVVGPPNSFRFPDFFTLNLQLERRVHMLGYELALRGGFENVTGRRNPTFVNNNVDSPEFLTFAGGGHRSFTGRIRFLGRK